MATTSNFGWPTPDDSDAVSQGAAAIRSLGSAIDATVGGGYLYAGTRYYTSSGTFAKADPLGTGDIGLRGIRVRCQGGGGAGGGAPATGAGETSVGAGGGSGVYAESFVTDIAGLSSSVTVTVGAGGTGGAGNGGGGGTSSFGSLVSANGGNGGLSAGPAAAPLTASVSAAASTGVGDLVCPGAAGTLGMSFGDGAVTGGSGGNGASSIFVGGARGFRNGQADSGGYGAGGGGSRRGASSSAVDGGSGGAGLVVVDCFV